MPQRSAARPPSSAAANAVLNAARLGPFAAIAGFALLLRLVYIRQIQPAPFFSILMGDSRSYDAWAGQIASGDWIGRDVFYQAPLYPYVLGLLYALLGRDLVVVRVMQSCLGAISCALLAHAGWRLFSKPAGIIAGLCLACYAPAIFFDGLIQKTALDAFLTTLALWIISGVIVGPRGWRTWAALGVTMAALSLTRENALLLVGVLGVWAILGQSARPAAVDSWRVRFTSRLLPFAVGLALLLVPVATRNALVGGGFYLTTSQFGPNLYLGNNPATDGTAGSLVGGRGSAEYERQDATELAERAMGRTLTPGEVSSYWTSRALAFVRAQPTAWLRLMARKTALVWNAAEAFDTESQDSYAEWSPLLATAATFGNFGALVPLAFVGIAATWARRRTLSILYTLIVGYAASVVMFAVYARYRFPLAPMLILFAAAAFSDGRAFVRRSSRARVAAVFAVTIALAAFVQWPLLDRRSMLSVSEHNLGAALQAEGRLDEAIAHYRKAIATESDYVPAYSNLGTALLAGGDAAGAIAAYTEALRIDPDFADARFNLGNALLDRGEPAAAVEHFRRALQRSPDAVDMRTNLGVALVASGRVEEGVAELETAVTRSPRPAAALRALGEALAQQGKEDLALERLTQAVTMAPDDGAARYARGRLLIEMGKTNEGIAELRAALARPPVSADAYNDLGSALASQGQLDEAARLLTQALDTRPDFLEARRNLAQVHAELQRRRP